MPLADPGINYPHEAFFRYIDPPEPVIFPVLPLTRKMQEQEAYGVDP